MTARTTTVSTRAPRIALVGSYGTGLTMLLDRFPQAGETVGGARFSSGPGGKSSNQAVGAARLGAQVSLLTAIGDDEFGAAARRLWRSEGIDDQHVVTAPAATMVGVILVEPDGENRIALAPGALEHLTPEHVTPFTDVIAAADLLMVCNEIPVPTVVAALGAARQVGTPTLYNPAPARDLPAAARSTVDYLTPNLGEARLLAGVDHSADIDAIVAELRERYAAHLILTAGADGAYVIERESTTVTHVPAARPSQVVDTTGAGDAFNAALAVALCRGWSVHRAARLAAAAGAFAVGAHEVIPGLGTVDEIAALADPELADDLAHQWQRGHVPDP